MSCWKKINYTLASILLLAALAAPCGAVEYFLRADTTNVTMADGTSVKMWGFALEQNFGDTLGTVTIPGPRLVVPADDSQLIVHVDNNLTADNIGLSYGCPVSIVIPGQIAVMSPVRHGTTGPGAPYAGRVRSFTHETMPGNTESVTYTWNDVQPGSFLYHSGTHPSCHVQMGLYGCVTKNAIDADTIAGTPAQAYAGVPYNAEAIVFYSEVDTEFHKAVSTNNYGPGKDMTSQINYKPDFFLVNGKSFTPGTLPAPAGAPGGILLIRMLNAGFEPHTPMLQGAHMNIVAEDGNLYPYMRNHYAVLLAAMQTKDAVVSFAQAGSYPLFDRALFLTNKTRTPGGFYTILSVNPAP